MKTYEQFHEEKMSDEDMMIGIEKSFNKQFPHSMFKIGFGDGIGSDTIFVMFGILDNKSVPNGITMNDPMYHQISLFPHTKGFGAELSTGSLMINPPVGSHLAMGRIKTKWRKTTGDHKKMIKTFDTFFKRLKVLVKENESNIFGRQNYDDKFFK